VAVSVDIDAKGEHILINAEWRYKELCKSLPGASWSVSEQVWRVPLSWTTCLALRSTFRSELVIKPNLAAWAANEVETRINPANALRELETYDGDSVLFPHQRAGVAFLATAKRALLADEPGLGKSLANSETVLTPSGFIPISEIEVGSYVIGSNGKPTEVVGVFPQGVRDIYRVTFSDGSDALVDLNHLWQVENARTGFTRVLTTNEIIKSGLRRSDGHRKFRIPLVLPVQFSKSSELEIDAYVLGQILGDGNCDALGRTRLTTADIETVELVVSNGYPLTYRSKYDYYFPGLAPKMKALKLNGLTSSIKKIPEKYLRASVKDRLALVRGLMDSDGWVSKDGTIVQFTSVSVDLVEGMTELVQSLGGIVRRTYKNKPKGGNFPVHTLTLNTPFNPFHLERKASLWYERKIYPASRYIDSIEFVRKEEATCIKVKAEDHLFVMRNYIVTHNTAQAIRALKELHNREEDVFPILIVCPNTLKKNWAREFNMWWPDVKTQVIKGSALQRKRQFEEPAEVFIINWESLRSHSRLASYGSVSLTRCKACGGQDEKISETRCEVHKRELNSIDFKAVVADECHRVKDPKSKQNRALLSASGNAEIRFALTGTPISNNVVDMWPILHWISTKDWPSKTKWIERMVDIMLNAFGGMMVLGVKPHMTDEFYKSINPYMRRMLKKVVLPHLPPVMHERRDVEMSTKQKKAYEQMRDKMIAELESGDILSAPGILTQTIRLLQFASSYATMQVNEETGEQKAVLGNPSCKIDALMSDIENGDFGDDSIAVCAVSKQLINLLSAELTKQNIFHGLITGDQDEDERQKAIDDFQSGRIKWILFTAQAGGVGITLTAARRLIMLQRPWSLVDHKQVLDRVHRIGSEIHDSIVITDYVTEGTVEERVIQVLETKADNFEQIVRDKDQLLKLLKEDKEGNL